MGCGLSSANNVIIQRKEMPKPVYTPINVDFSTFEGNPFESNDLDYNQQYMIGPYFNPCTSQFEVNKNIFYKLFKNKVDDLTNILISITKYNNFIKNSLYLEDYDEIQPIKNLILTNNLRSFKNLNISQINEQILYCNNNLFRVSLYLQKLKKVQINPNFLKIHPSNVPQEFINKTKEIIEKDVYRTFPKLVIFQNSKFGNYMHDVLYEFAIRNQKLGYYQGMNFIAGFLMLILGAEKELCLYFMVKLFSLKSKIFNLSFEDCFTNDFNLLRKYMQFFHEKLKEYYPGMNEKYLEINAIDEIWIWKWIELCFLTCVKMDVATKFFDIIIAKGIDSLIAISLTIVDFFFKDFIKCVDLVQFNEIIANGYVELNDEQKEKFYKKLYRDIEENKYKIF